eukprot:TRINITY_DN6427_c0_g1_i1.p3 TRINITY_DN6427_c0_g1~~TRINITY_DN6427_c0_g1_i1.p3  ORF type:complete len:208 (+),score=35.73 TRINITY_DN6427_c0_g1_i1:1043-1666(+)
MLESHKEAARHHSVPRRVQRVVGCVIGDHVHASFNAVKKCVSHARNAIQSAVDLHVELEACGIHVVTGVANGFAHCGPLGCSELMSIATIGPSTVTASVLQELCGNGKTFKIICSGGVYSEVSYAFDMKIILEKVAISKARRRTDKRIIAYEVLLGRRARIAVDDDEWMYQLEERPWDTYNKAGKQYLLGESDEALHCGKCGMRSQN